MTTDQWLRLFASVCLLTGLLANAWALYHVGRALLSRPPSPTPGTLKPGPAASPEQQKANQELVNKLIESLREKAEKKREQSAVRNGMPPEDVMRRGNKVITPQ